MVNSSNSVTFIRLKWTICFLILISFKNLQNKISWTFFRLSSWLAKGKNQGKKIVSIMYSEKSELYDLVTIS